MTTAHKDTMRNTLLIIFAFSILTSGAAAPKRKTAPKPKRIDVGLVVDSAMILADNYAEAVANKPEMVQSRMNAIKRFYAPYAAQKSVADSICGSIYNVYVDNIERDNVVRANAFKDCFLAIADKDNENLGPLYATELAVAQENADTTTISYYIPLLRDYSKRLGYDYDDILEIYSNSLNNFRMRKPLRDALPGIWVSEDIAGVGTENGIIDEHEGKYNWINECKIIQIRDGCNSIYKSIPLYSDSIYGLDIVRIDASGQKDSGFDTYNGVIANWEQSAHNINTNYVYKIPEGVSGRGAPNPHGKKVVIDNNCYSVYVFWGDERLKRNNAEIGAIIRQTTQNMQAVTAGHLSRSKFSNTKRIAGNLASDLASVGINSIVDALMVSTDMIWSIEITFHMINPYCLESELRSNTIVAKSNSSNVDSYVYTHKTRYYRWEPEDSVDFVGAEGDVGTIFVEDKPWEMAGMIFCINPSNEQKNEAQRRNKEFEKEFKVWYKQKIKDYQEQLNRLDKNSPEYITLKKEIKAFKQYKSAPKAWQKWNAESLAKLKAKADNYIPNHLNTSL